MWEQKKMKSNMEPLTDTENSLPENEMSSDTNEEKIFTKEKIPEIVRIFKEADADGSGGLDMEEFHEVMEQINPDIPKDEILALHMKIDTNCDRSVDLGELLHYLLKRNEQAEALDFRNILFPNDFTYRHAECLKPIVKMICRLSSDITAPDFRDYMLSDSLRPYQKYDYITVASNGILKFWSNDFKLSKSIPLQERERSTPAHHHIPRLQVTDMVYINDLKMLAVSTTDREVLFYVCETFSEMTSIKYAILEEDIRSMDYYSKENKAVFACADSRGYLFVFASYAVHKEGLFSKEKFHHTSLRHYPTATVSSLLTKTKKTFDSVKTYLFDDICGQLQYIPSIHSFAVCSESSKFMGLIECIFDQERPKPLVSSKIFRSEGNRRYFKCVSYSHWSRYLMTGGMGGILRVWFPNKTNSYERALVGHKEAITHIVYNTVEKIFVSISTDKTICLWNDGNWICKQRICPTGLASIDHITSVCYNVYNNELFVANSVIGKCFGRGTNVFLNNLTSHRAPLSSMLYHSIYNQVVSVCHKGKVTVWDVLTGQAVMEFDILPKKYSGPTFISFDEVNRKLITISSDRMVKLWNFNSGEQLEVLPEKLPNEVTSLVCTNDMMFISTKNSSKILLLDSDGNLKKALEHFLLGNISSMDYHDNLLITASTNGNILTWALNGKEHKVLYYINTTRNSKVQLLEVYLKKIGVEKDLLNKIDKQNKEERVLFIKSLKSREASLKTGTLLTIGDVYIGIWSTKIDGGLISRFEAVIEQDAKITCVSLSENETTLLTGDSKGVVCLYDIQKFGLQTNSTKTEFEEIEGCKLHLQSTPLLASWKAGLSKLESVVCDPSCEKVITAEVDYNVKLWKNTGSLVGIFGKDKWVGMVTKQVPHMKEICEPESLPVKEEKKVIDKMVLDHLVMKYPGLLPLKDYLNERHHQRSLEEKEPEDPIPCALGTFGNTENELWQVIKLKQLYFKEFISDHIRCTSRFFNVPIELESPVTSASEDENKEAELSAIVSEEKNKEAEQSASAREDKRKECEKSEKSTENINLPEKVDSSNLLEEKTLHVKPCWPVNLFLKGATELLDMTKNISTREKFSETKTDIERIPSTLTEVQLTQAQQKPQSLKTPVSAGTARHAENKKDSECEKKSTGEALETPDVILPLPEGSKKYKFVQEILKLGKKEDIHDEIQKTELPLPIPPKAKLVDFTKPLVTPPLSKTYTSKHMIMPIKGALRNTLDIVEQMPVPLCEKETDFAPLLQRSTKMQSTKSTEKENPLKSPDLEDPFMLTKHLSESKSKEKFDQHSTSALQTFEGGELQSSPHSSTTKKKTFRRAEHEQHKIPSTSERINVIKSTLKNLQSVTTQPKVKTTSTTKTSDTTSKKVHLVQTQQKPQPPMTRNGQIRPVGSSKTDGRTTPASSKKMHSLLTEKKPHPSMTTASPSRAVDHSRTHKCSIEHKHVMEISVQTSRAPLEKVQPLWTEKKPHPPITPASLSRSVESSRTHMCRRGHTHERETYVRPSPAPLEKVQPLWTEKKPDHPITPASQSRSVQSSRTHVCRSGHTHERETHVRPSPAPLKKVQPLQTEKKPLPPITPASPSRLVERSRKHTCRRGHTHERETYVRPPSAPLEKVQPLQTEKKPHPPIIPKSQSRLVESSRTHTCRRGHTYERETHVRPAPLEKVQPLQTEKKPLPPITPTSPSRLVESSRTHTCRRGHTHERETHVRPAPLEKVQPLQTEKKPLPPITPTSPSRLVESSRTHKCRRGHTHEREKYVRPSTALLKKVQPLQTEKKPHAPKNPASPSRAVESSRVHTCRSGHTHERETHARQSSAPLEKVLPLQPEKKPHPPITPASPFRSAESSRTHTHRRGYKHDRKAHVQPLLASLKKVQTLQTEKNPHPSMTPASTSRNISTTHICRCGNTYKKEKNIQVLPAITKKVLPYQTQQKLQTSITVAGPTRPVLSSDKYKCSREDFHVMKTNPLLPPIYRKMEPPEKPQSNVFLPPVVTHESSDSDSEISEAAAQGKTEQEKDLGEEKSPKKTKQVTFPPILETYHGQRY